MEREGELRHGPGHGGAGYVGAHTCKALSRAGYLPVVVDNLSTGDASFVRWGPLIEADIRNSDAIFSALRSYQVEAVLHFAASAYVGESVTDPQIAGTIQGAPHGMCPAMPRPRGGDNGF